MTDWSNIPDEEFDDVFRKPTENHEEILWPDAWQKMSEKLDEKDKKRRFIVWWRYAAVLVVGLLIGLLTFNKVYKPEVLTNNSNDNTESNTESKNGFNNNINNKPTAILPNQNTVPASIDKLANPNQTSYQQKLNSEFIKTETKRSKYLIKQKENIAFKSEITNTNDKKKIENIENLSSVVGGKTDNPIKPSIQEKGQDQISKNEIITKSPEDQKSEKIAVNAPKTNDNEIITKSPEDQKSEKIAINDTKTNDKELKSIDTTLTEQPIIAENNQNSISEIENTGSDPSVDLKKSTSRRKLSILIGASPDYSTLGFEEMQPMGYNLQLGLEYNLSKKLKISAGVMRSQKKYGAYPKNYTWPSNWGVPSNPLKEISASCNMIDLPVGLKYEFSQRKKTTFYSAFGVTNYYMVKEKYNYYYENDSDPNLKMRKWEGSTGFAGAGVLNFSFGIEREISKYFRLQLEPFIKTPIKTIGMGNVKLFSSGIFLNIVPQNFIKKRNQ